VSFFTFERRIAAYYRFKPVDLASRRFCGNSTVTRAKAFDSDPLGWKIKDYRRSASRSTN